VELEHRPVEQILCSSTGRPNHRIYCKCTYGVVSYEFVQVLLLTVLWVTRRGLRIRV